jgi:hypothetical protein
MVEDSVLRAGTSIFRWKGLAWGTIGSNISEHAELVEKEDRPLLSAVAAPSKISALRVGTERSAPFFNKLREKRCP